EIHHEDTTITSVQKMTTENTFLLRTADKEIFLTDEYIKKSKGIQEKLVSDTEHTLAMVWDRWIAEQGIKLENYELIPLIALDSYNEKTLPSFTQAETDKIIGQLWEGLYKSYLIPLLDSSHNIQNDYMPIILISHDKTHLVVLYEQNKEIKSLYQKI